MTQRLIRVLVYEGSPEWIQSALQHRTIKGSYILQNGCTIREAVVGDFIEEVLSTKPELYPDTEADGAVFCGKCGGRA